MELQQGCSSSNIRDKALPLQSKAYLRQELNLVGYRLIDSAQNKLNIGLNNNSDGALLMPLSCPSGKLSQ
jgi:hypothetical protein